MKKSELRQMIREMLHEELSKEKLTEACTVLDPGFYFEDLDVSIYAIMHFARRLVNQLVNDPAEAEALYTWAVGYESTDEELIALSDMIGDALEGANYHDEVHKYMRSDPFPYFWSFRANSYEKATMDKLFTECKTDDEKRRALMLAINQLVLEIGID